MAGFHVPGEMSGIWQHPIKLMDGFALSVQDGSEQVSLNRCDGFVSYPLASQFIYGAGLKGLEIIRTDFAPDSLPVLAVEYQLRNTSDQPKKIILTFTANTDLSPVWLGERSGMVDARDQYRAGGSNAAFAKDSLNNWFVGIASDLDSLSIDQPTNSPLQGQGISIRMHSQP